MNCVGDIIISKKYDKKNKNIKYKGQYRKNGAFNCVILRYFIFKIHICKNKETTLLAL